MLTGNREFNEIYEKYKNLVLKAASLLRNTLQSITEKSTAARY